MSEKVSDHLRCPICFEIPENEIYQCRNGHQVCAMCSVSLTLCPQCRVPVSSTNQVRNRAMENLLDEMKFKCTFEDKGCAKMVKRQEISNHQKTCNYKPFYLCKLIGYKNCNITAHAIPLLTVKHLQQVHNIKVFEGMDDFRICHENFVESVMDRTILANPTDSRKQLTFCRSVPVLWKLEKDDYSPKMIILSTINYAKNAEKNGFVPKSCSWTCLYMGDSSDEASQYQVTFSICNVLGKGGKGEDAVLTWKVTPVPYRTLESELIKQSFAVPLSFIMENVIQKKRENRSLVVKVGIAKLVNSKLRDIRKEPEVKILM